MRDAGERRAPDLPPSRAVLGGCGGAIAFFFICGPVIVGVAEILKLVGIPEGVLDWLAGIVLLPCVVLGIYMGIDKAKGDYAAKHGR